MYAAKTEIKFENESARWHILMATIRETLGKFNAVPSIDFDMEGAPEIPALGEMESVSLSVDGRPSAPRPQFSNSYNPFRQDPNSAHWESLYQEFADSQDNTSLPPQQKGETDEAWLPSALTEAPSMTSISSSDVEQNRAVTDTDLLGSRMNRISAVGQNGQYFQLAGRYICTALKSGLMLIDQHRAHINILYDRHLEQLKSRKGISQSELFPEAISFAAADIPILESVMPELQCLGFELDNLGGGSYALCGKPATMGKGDVAEVLRGMIETARAHDGSVGDELQSRLALRLATAEAIPYGQLLTTEEMEQLADSLFALTTPNYTPDGKSVLTILTYDELQSRFA